MKTLFRVAFCLLLLSLNLPAAAHHLGNPIAERARYADGDIMYKFLQGKKPDRVAILAVVHPNGTLYAVLVIFETHPSQMGAVAWISMLRPDFEDRKKAMTAWRRDGGGHISRLGIGPVDELLAMGFTDDELSI